MWGPEGKDAFQAFFGTLPFRRLCKDSWKSEYILRTHLIRYVIGCGNSKRQNPGGLNLVCWFERKWEKGRGSIIQFNPKVGSIDAIAVDMENSTMLAASAEQGITRKPMQVFFSSSLLNALCRHGSQVQSSDRKSG